MSSLTSKTSRKLLKVRRDPYFLKLGNGNHLGFRRGPDTWIARHRDKAGKMHFQSLGDIEDFADAKAQADQWFDAMKGGARRSAVRGTVREALHSYLGHLRQVNRPVAAAAAEGRFTLAVFNDPLADLRVDQVTLNDFEEWQLRLQLFKPRGVTLENREAALARIDAGEPLALVARGLQMSEGTLRHWRRRLPNRATGGRRAPQTIDDIVGRVQAALNKAVEKLGYVGNKNAWGLENLGNEEDERIPAVFLSPVQRKHLLSHCAAIEPFCLALDYTGARPGEMARATVADFDAGSGLVAFRTRKGGGKWRTRQTPLGQQAIAFFRAQCKDKLPAAFLVANPDGGQWMRRVWAKEIRKARMAANAKQSPTSQRYIPAHASAYSFRHSRISELLQVAKIDATTVCKHTGTSLEMLHKYYWHLIPDSTRAALDALEARA